MKRIITLTAERNGKTMKRIISLLLSAIMLVGAMALVSCALEDEEYAGNVDEGFVCGLGTTTPSTTIINKPSYFGNPTFDGAVVKFALASAVMGDLNSDGYRGCDVDEDNGDLIVSKVYKRNQNVEERFDVDIQVVECTDEKSLTELVTPILLAGDDDIDCLWADQSYDIDLCLNGFLLDLNKLDKSENYIELDSSWWDGDYTKQYQYNDELYWLSGPLSLTYLGGMSCVFVNEMLYDQYILPDYGNIADIVRAGEWNISTLAKMSNDIYTKSGNKIMGSMLAGQENITQLLVGAGAEYTERHADGTISLNLSSADSKYVSVAGSIMKMFTQVEGVGSLTSFGDSFAYGGQLFRFGKLSDAYAFIEAEYNWLMVPTPKLNSNQSEYRTAMASNNQLIGIAYTCRNVPAVTATLEAMAAESSRLVTPAFYDYVARYKYTRDDDTAEMLDMISDSVYTDFGMAWERYIFGSSWINGGKYDFSTITTLAKKENWASNLKTVINKLDELSK